MHARTIVVTALVGAFAVVLSGDARAEKDWTAHMGDLPFVVGIERGREEVKLTGRPAMLFFTSASDKWCPQFAARTWTDKEVLKNVEGYTPVLIDVEATPKEFLEAHLAVIVPGVQWIDFDEKHIFMAMGDSPLDIFKLAAERARNDCPAARPPAEGLAPLLELGKKLAESLKAKDVKGTLATIAEIRKVGHGGSVQKAARAADAQLTKDGEAEITRAKGLIAAKKKPDAKKALEKLVADYGAEHPVAKAAQALLTEMAAKPAPKK